MVQIDLLSVKLFLEVSSMDTAKTYRKLYSFTSFVIVFGFLFGLGGGQVVNAALEVPAEGGEVSGETIAIEPAGEVSLG